MELQNSPDVSQECRPGVHGLNLEHSCSVIQFRLLSQGFPWKKAEQPWFSSNAGQK